ncbi:MAG: M1 family metallopeptidase [Acidobacteriota bacterium]|nr:M1 family metallopeptidase [Acidobacteriota bacterium]
MLKAKLAFFFLFATLPLQAVFAQDAVTTRVRTFDAEHYTIRLSFDRKTKTVFGETTVVVKPLKDNFRVLSLDAVNLQVQSVTPENSVKPLTFQNNSPKLDITLDKAYSANETVSVRIKYRAVNPRAGVYFVEPLTRNGRQIRPAQIWTQGEPEDNRNWFPSYDFPDDKATTEQFITTTSADETAIGNGELIEVKNNPNGTKTFHYRMNQPHVTYLVSFVVGKYQKFSDKYGSVPLGYFLYPDRPESEKVLSLAYGKTPKMFALFEKTTGVKFPFAKYDQIVVGNFDAFAGMENITATTMADTEIYNALEPAGLRNTENLVTHELAHSWFGNLVTCKNWSELWLNEGFATFMESVFIENEYGRAAYLEEMRSNAEQAFAQEDINLKHPLVNLRARPDPLLFDSITYKKGGFVVHMLRETVGEEMFWKSVNAYLNAHKFGSVETTDLQRAFEQTSGKDLNWFFEQWTRKAGYPNLKITPAYNPAAKQLRFVIKQTQKADSQTPAFFRISANIEIETPDGTKTERIEMIQREQTFTFSFPRKPTKIVFDKGEQILKKVDIEPVTNF